MVFSPKNKKMLLKIQNPSKKQKKKPEKIGTVMETFQK